MEKNYNVNERYDEMRNIITSAVRKCDDINNSNNSRKRLSTVTAKCFNDAEWKLRTIKSNTSHPWDEDHKREMIEKYTSDLNEALDMLNKYSDAYVQEKIAAVKQCELDDILDKDIPDQLRKLSKEMSAIERDIRKTVMDNLRNANGFTPSSDIIDAEEDKLLWENPRIKEIYSIKVKLFNEYVEKHSDPGCEKKRYEFKTREDLLSFIEVNQGYKLQCIAKAVGVFGVYTWDAFC